MINYIVGNAKLKLKAQIKILSYINHNIYTTTFNACIIYLHLV